MALPVGSARPVRDFRLGAPVSLKVGSRPTTLRRLQINGPHEPARPALTASLKGIRELSVGTTIVIDGEPRHYQVSGFGQGGVPQLQPAGYVEMNMTAADGSSWIIMQDELDKKSGILYISLKQRDYYGLTQDVTRAAIESCVDVLNMQGAEDGYASGSIGNVMLKVKLKPGDRRGPLEVLDYFKQKLTERIAARDRIESEGQKLFHVYQALVSGAAKFAETFPSQLTKAAVEAAFQNNPEAARAIIKYLRIKFDPVYAPSYGISADALPSVVLRIKNAIESCQKADEKAALTFLLRLAVAIEQTNVFDYNRNLESSVFRFNKDLVQEVVAEANISLPEDLVFVHTPETGSYSISARFGGLISKGGDRYFLPVYSPENYEKTQRSSLSEALRLGWTQWLKNALWGCFVNGLKTVLVAAPLGVDEKTDVAELKRRLATYIERKVYTRICAAIGEVKVNDKPVDLPAEVGSLLNADQAEKDLAKKLFAQIIKLQQLDDLIRLSDAEIYLGTLGDKYPGPDANMVPQHMEYLTVLAQHGNVVGAEAIYTGKGQGFGGFPHSLWGVTSRGVFNCLKIAMKYLQIAEDATVTIQGFGDVGGNMVKLILEQSKLRITAISDDSGILECKEGFQSDSAIKGELLRLQEKGLKLREFDQLIMNGKVIFKDRRGEGFVDDIVTRPSDIFIPASPLKNVINKQNVREVIAAHRLVAEGANISFEPGADEIFDRNGGMRIIDFFANGAGVKTSEGEILSTLVLGVDGVLALYDQLREQNYAVLDKIALESSEYFWGQYFRLKGTAGSLTMPEVCKKTAKDITTAKSIIKINDDLINLDVLFDSLFPAIVGAVDDRNAIIDRLGRPNVKEKVAVELARRVILSHEVSWLDSVADKDQAVREEALKIIAASNKVMA